MNRISSYCAIVLLCCIAVMSACSGSDNWKVKASVKGAENRTAILEICDNGQWIAVDSTKIDGNGAFDFKKSRNSFPDIYRITIGDKSVYFPVDSTETVTVTADYATMDSKSSISGSSSADMMQKINVTLADALAKNKPADVVNDAALKRALAEIVQNDWADIAAYYLINKTIGNRYLYDPSVAFDRGIISAVANAYLTGKPDDPRTKMLEEMAVSSRRAYGKGSSFTALEIYFPEINLKDFNQKEQSLSDLWRDSKVMVVNFTAYTTDLSPATQMALGEVYKKYHDRGLNIYQVGCDPEEYRWRMAAEIVPWTAVYCPSTDAEQVLRYNVTALPTTFVIDGSGEHIERVDDLSTLDAVVAKYM